MHRSGPSLISNTETPLHHGGRLNQAVKRFNRARDQWLDLSTGINPLPWPVPTLTPACWSRLPETDDGLLNAARDYYQTESLLAVAGSQTAIQALPELLTPARVALPRIGYAEHHRSWQRAGHQLLTFEEGLVESVLDQTDHLLLIQPNNPTGQRFAPEKLLAWHQSLQRRGGYLIVDEAFIDPQPHQSLASYSPRPGLVVLRSIGKFFGLAGIRCGFVIAEDALLATLENRLGPWTVSGPSREVCRLALQDHNWQHKTRQQLELQGPRLQQLLHRRFATRVEGCELFQTVHHAAVVSIYRQLAEQGVLVRLFEHDDLLRFGLPNGQDDWRRLEQALENVDTRSN